MPTNVLDALLPNVAPPRAAEPAPRGGEQERFAPALQQALGADRSAPADDSVENVNDAATSELDLSAAEEATDDVTAEQSGVGPSDFHEEEAAADDDDEGDESDASDEAAAEASAGTQNAQQAVDEAQQAAVNASIDAIAPTVQVKDATTPTESTPNAIAPGVDANDDEGDDAQAQQQAARSTLREFGDVLQAEVTRVDASTKESPVVDKKRSAPVGDSKPRNGKSATTGSQRSPASGDNAADERPESATVKDAESGAGSKAPAEQLSDGAAPSAHERRHAQHATAGDAPEASTAPVADLPTAPTGAVVDSHSTADVNASDEGAVGPPALSPADPPPSSRGAAALARLSAERAIPANAGPNGEDHGIFSDRARFVGRVEGALRAAQQRDGRVHVRLSPPELGALRIELTVHQGAMSAHVEAETPAARNLLLDNLPALRERLAQQDIRVERFDVDLRQGTSGGGSGHPDAQDRQAREPNPRQPLGRMDRVAAVTSTAPGRGTAGALVSNAAIDVRV